MRVVLNKEWQRAGEAAVVARDDVAGLPRRAVADAAALLERRQELVLEERAVAGERIPGGGVDGAERSKAFELHAHAASVPVAAASVEPSDWREIGLGAGGVISIISALRRLTTVQLE